MKTKTKKKAPKMTCLFWLLDKGIDVSNYDFNNTEHEVKQLTTSSLKLNAAEVKEKLNHKFTERFR